jgi:hypothetical protein
MEFVIITLVTVAVVVAAIAISARTRPPGSGGAPGEVVGDRPLSQPTGASVDDSDHAGPAEDRPGGPSQEAMDPDAFDSPATDDHR